MQQVTAWHAPCGCQVAYAWDDTEPETDRTHRAIAVTPCAVHEADAADVPRVAARYARVGSALVSVDHQGRRGEKVPQTAHAGAAHAWTKIQQGHRGPG